MELQQYKVSSFHFKKINFMKSDIPNFGCLLVQNTWITTTIINELYY